MTWRQTVIVATGTIVLVAVRVALFGGDELAFLVAAFEFAVLLVASAAVRQGAK